MEQLGREHAGFPDDQPLNFQLQLGGVLRGAGVGRSNCLVHATANRATTDMLSHSNPQREGRRLRSFSK